MLRCGRRPDETAIVFLKHSQSLCLDLSCGLRGDLIKGRLHFGYCTFWLWPQTRWWDDGVGLYASPPLRWSSSQLSLLHLLLCVHQAVSLSLRLADLDLLLVLSTCRKRIWLWHVAATSFQQLAFHLQRPAVLGCTGEDNKQWLRQHSETLSVCWGSVSRRADGWLSRRSMMRLIIWFFLH